MLFPLKSLLILYIKSNPRNDYGWKNIEALRDFFGGQFLLTIHGPHVPEYMLSIEMRAIAVRLNIPSDIIYHHMTEIYNESIS